MNTNSEKILYSVLLIMSLLTFILQIFVFKAPDGILGFMICLICIYLIVGSLVKLCKSSKVFKDYFIGVLDLLFWLP